MMTVLSDERTRRLISGFQQNEIAEAIKKDEEEHEKLLIDIISEERLSYLGSVVLGLNDALVEFTGALAGFTFALQNPRLIGLTGIIMGFSASFSMAASEYLSTKAEAGSKSPIRASLYTGLAYLSTVGVLVAPFIILNNQYYALAAMLVSVIILIMMFNYYYSVVKNISFRARFIEMLGISSGVAALSFLIGLGIRYYFGVEI